MTFHEQITRANCRELFTRCGCEVEETPDGIFAVDVVDGFVQHSFSVYFMPDGQLSYAVGLTSMPRIRDFASFVCIVEMCAGVAGAGRTYRDLSGDSL